MKKFLRMRCKACGHWNRVPVNKIFIERDTPEPKVKAYIPVYSPLKVSTCKKCGEVIAQPNELIQVTKP